MFESKGLNEFVNIRAFSEDVSNMEELEFLIMDDGYAERETYMLADLVGVDINSKDTVKLYFKVKYVTDQDSGEVYRDVMYNEEFKINKIRDFIKSDNINHILKYIGRSFILYITYCFSGDHEDFEEYVTEIQTDKLMMI